MLKLLGLMIIILVIAVGMEYFVTTSFSEEIRITVNEKYTDGDIYVVKTMALQTFGTNGEIYNKLEIGKTYHVKIFMGNIREVIES
jgi:hypothetical protein